MSWLSPFRVWVMPCVPFGVSEWVCLRATSHRWDTLSRGLVWLRLPLLNIHLDIIGIKAKSCVLKFSCLPAALYLLWFPDSWNLSALYFESRCFNNVYIALFLCDGLIVCTYCLHVIKAIEFSLISSSKTRLALAS